MKKSNNYVIYADDTALFTTIQSSNICAKDVEYLLNIELNKINEWLKSNKLSLNVKKSKYIIHTFENKQINNVLRKIDETVIERVQTFKMFDVNFERKSKLGC